MFKYIYIIFRYENFGTDENKYRYSNDIGVNTNGGLVKMSKHDIKKANSLLKQNWIPFEPTWKNSLLSMLETNTKAEIEHFSDELVEYIIAKMNELSTKMMYMYR